jgi:hypothetical protein
MDEGIPFGSYAERQRDILRRSQSNVKCAARGVLGLLLFLTYVNDIWKNSE